jgi:hypothetical protein
MVSLATRPLNDPNDLRERLAELANEKRRLAELVVAYRIVAKSRFARIRALLGRAASPRLRADLSPFALDMPALDPAALTWELPPLRRAAPTATGTPLGEPLISIVFAAHDDPPARVAATVATLRAQTYERWELCIDVSGSTNEATRAALADAEAASARVFVSDGLAAPASDAIVAAHRLASGAYLAFPGEFKRFAPDALARCVDFLRGTPEADVLFADSGLIDVGRFALLRRDFVTELGGPHAALGASHAGDVVAHLAGRSERVYSL